MNLKYENLALGFVGDIHGEFQKLQKIIKPFENTVFIIVGDCGFGFPNTKEGNINKMIKASFKAFLEKRNLYLLFMRGNHDNPKMFNQNLFNERFRLIPDYTFIEVDGTSILCVGGAVSVDRRLRQVNSSYWYNEEMLDFQATRYKPDILCTHTINKEMIDYYLPIMPDWLKISFEKDKKLYPDGFRENMICQKLFDYYTPKYWIHGHYHISNRIEYNNCKVIS